MLEFDASFGRCEVPAGLGVMISMAEFAAVLHRWTFGTCARHRALLSARSAPLSLRFHREFIEVDLVTVDATPLLYDIWRASTRNLDAHCGPNSDHHHAIYFDEKGHRRTGAFHQRLTEPAL